MLKLTFRQQVVAGFTISLLFVLISAVTSYYSIRSLNEDSAWESHTYQVIDHAQNLEVKLLNSETGLRGYVLTQKSNYLDPYNKNAGKIMPEIKELERLTKDNYMSRKG